jgi:hypothetical protein
MGVPSGFQYPMMGAQAYGSYPHGYTSSSHQVHTTNAEASTTGSVNSGLVSAQAPQQMAGFNPPSALWQTGYVVEMPLLSIPRSVVDQSDRIAKEFGRVFEMAERYAVSQWGEAPDNRNPQPIQLPMLATIGIEPNRVNGKNRTQPDPAWVKDRIISEAPSGAEAYRMMGNYQDRIRLTTRVLVNHLSQKILQMGCFGILNNNSWRSELTDSMSNPAATVQMLNEENRYEWLTQFGHKIQTLRGYNTDVHPLTPKTLRELQAESWFNQSFETSISRWAEQRSRCHESTE